MGCSIDTLILIREDYWRTVSKIFSHIGSRQKLLRQMKKKEVLKFFRRYANARNEENRRVNFQNRRSFLKVFSPTSCRTNLIYLVKIFIIKKNDIMNEFWYSWCRCLTKSFPRVCLFKLSVSFVVSSQWNSQYSYDCCSHVISTQISLFNAPSYLHLKQANKMSI